MSTENDRIIKIRPTCNFGKTTENSIYYDVTDEIGPKNLLYYRISKIICQIKSNESIHGIKFIYI